MDSPSQETLAMSCITLLCPSATPSLISFTFLAPLTLKGGPEVESMTHGLNPPRADREGQRKHMCPEKCPEMLP